MWTKNKSHTLFRYIPQNFSPYFPYTCFHINRNWDIKCLFEFLHSHYSEFCNSWLRSKHSYSNYCLLIKILENGFFFRMTLYVLVGTYKTAALTKNVSVNRNTLQKLDPSKLKSRSLFNGILFIAFISSWFLTTPSYIFIWILLVFFTTLTAVNIIYCLLCRQVFSLFEYSSS